MAVTWKEVALADNVPNLGNENLDSTAGTRTFTLKQTEGTSSSRAFRIYGTSASGAGSPALSIVASGFNSTSNAAIPTFAHAYNGSSIDFTSSGIMQFNSSIVWSCQSPAPFFLCDQMIIKNDATNDVANPVLNLKRTPVGQHVGATGDNLGVIKFTGENDANGEEEYASINTKISDASAGTEDGEMNIQLMNAGYSTSALKILPLPAEKLKAIEVYGTDLWNLVRSATMYNCRKQLKLRAAHNSTKGLLEDEATLFRFADLTYSSAKGNNAYDITATPLSSWISGATNIRAAEGQYGLMSQDADYDSGIADAWMVHKRTAGSPSVTIKVHGVVWWQSRYDQIDGQKVQFLWGHHGRTASSENPIVDNNDFGFSYGGIASGEFPLAAGLTINKIPVSFTKTFDAGGDGDVLEMFILAIKAIDTNGVPAIGQSDSEEDTAAHNTTFVADLEMEVLALSA